MMINLTDGLVIRNADFEEILSFYSSGSVSLTQD